MKDSAILTLPDGSTVLLKQVKDTTVDQYRLAECTEDSRVLPLVLTDAGRRQRTWREVCEMMTIVEYTDWIVPGPRTTPFCCLWLNKRGNPPLDYHRAFKHLYGLEKGDWGVEMHESGLRSLEFGACYDGLDVPNLAGIEVLMRQVQLVEYVYTMDGGGKKDKDGKKGKGRGKSAGLYEETDVFGGFHRQAGTSMICPELLEYVSKEVEKDASIFKQVRKAREERRLLGNDK